MPIYMDILPLERVVLIVARGQVSADEIAENTRKLVAANVPTYAKIIDVRGSASDLTKDQVNGVADMLRGRSDVAARGPVAFIIDPTRSGFADVFADVTKGERPVQLFRSLHEARKWLKENSADPVHRAGRTGSS